MTEEKKPDDLIPTISLARDHPTIFADAAWFASNLGNVIRIQFIENHFEPSNSLDPGIKARHVGTLAMPRQGFKNMVAYLLQMDEFFDNMDAENAATK
jgi:hypothetical protein